MIYITGDTHGRFGRINTFCQHYKTTIEDIMIILGDAGLNFWLNEHDDKNKELVHKIPITFLCIHGNHEERPYRIPTYKEKEWCGGIVYYEDKYPNILFAKDGEIYDFNGKKGMAIGGAYSVDKPYRIPRNVPWFESEQPSDEIKAYVESQLEKVGWRVDYVFSHTTPYIYEPRESFLPGIDQRKVDASTEQWLGEIEVNLDYQKWYCGHFHVDKAIDKIVIMNESIEVLDIGTQE